MHFFSNTPSGATAWSALQLACTEHSLPYVPGEPSAAEAPDALNSFGDFQNLPDTPKTAGFFRFLREKRDYRALQSMDCCSAVFLAVKSSGTSVGNLLLMICHQSLGFIYCAFTSSWLKIWFCSPEWGMYDSLQNRDQSVWSTVENNLRFWQLSPPKPLKTCPQDLFSGQVRISLPSSVDNVRRDLGDLPEPLLKAYTGCNGIAFICHQNRLSIFSLRWLLPWGNEPTTEFGKNILYI